MVRWLQYKQARTLLAYLSFVRVFKPGLISCCQRVLFLVFVQPEEKGELGRHKKTRSVVPWTWEIWGVPSGLAMQLCTKAFAVRANL